MHGEVGVLLVSWKLEPTPEKEERLFELVAANARNPSHELFNGSPGTMLAALHLYEQTGDERWRELWLTCADVLLEQFRTDPEYGCRLWIQYRRGQARPEHRRRARVRLERPLAASRRQRCSARSGSPNCRVPPAGRLRRWPSATEAS